MIRLFALLVLLMEVNWIEGQDYYNSPHAKIDRLCSFAQNEIMEAATKIAAINVDLCKSQIKLLDVLQNKPDDFSKVAPMCKLYKVERKLPDALRHIQQANYIIVSAKSTAVPNSPTYREDARKINDLVSKYEDIIQKYEEAERKVPDIWLRYERAQAKISGKSDNNDIEEHTPEDESKTPEEQDQSKPDQEQSKPDQEHEEPIQQDGLPEDVKQQATQKPEEGVPEGNPIDQQNEKTTTPQNPLSPMDEPSQPMEENGLSAPDATKKPEVDTSSAPTVQTSLPAPDATKKPEVDTSSAPTVQTSLSAPDATMKPEVDTSPTVHTSEPTANAPTPSNVDSKLNNNAVPTADASKPADDVKAQPLDGAPQHAETLQTQAPNMNDNGNTPMDVNTNSPSEQNSFQETAPSSVGPP